MFNLVTGASGFVGRHLVRRLVSLREPVRLLVRNADSAVGLKQLGVQIFVGDVCDRAIMNLAVRGVGTIYHCAAASSLCSDDEIRRTNLDGVRNLLHAIADHGTGRLVLMSSINVLGSCSFQAAVEDNPTRRTGEVHVDVKIDAEKLALDFAARREVDITILRPGLIYGTGEKHLPRLAQAIKLGKFAFIGSRANVVPLVFVADMVRAMIMASRQEPASHRTYHITDGSRTTIGELVDAIAEVTGSQRPRRVIPYVLPRVACAVCGKFGLDGPISRPALRFLGTSRHVDIRRAHEDLGFNPQVGFKEGIEQTATWLNGQNEDKQRHARAA